MQKFNHPRWKIMVPIESPFLVSYLTSIVSNVVSYTVFELLMPKSCDLELGGFKVIRGQMSCERGNRDDCVWKLGSVKEAVFHKIAAQHYQKVTLCPSIWRIICKILLFVIMTISIDYTNLISYGDTTQLFISYSNCRNTTHSLW